jgi:hypothetical protein
MAETKKRKTWYDHWHNSDHHVLTHWLILAVIVVFAWLLLHTQITNWILSFADTGVSVRLAQKEAQLSLDPQTSTVKVGDKITANIVIDTAGSAIDGVDVYSLHYDPSILQVIDDMSSKTGVQIQPGTILPVNAANTVNTKTGTIKFGQLAAGGTSFHGQGVLATIHFKALAAGTAYLRFDFTQGSTTDSNAAYKGRDQLARVVDAIYTVQPK